MAWRPASSCLIVAVLSTALFGAHEARANGRPPATSSILFRQGMEQEIAIGLTFGLILSHDGGQTWGWMCEDAIGYQGMYDPTYAYTPTGALFASTFVGLKVERNGCTFDPTPAGTKFVSTEILAPDGSILYATSDPGSTGANPAPPDFDIERSANDGAAFMATASPIAAASVSYWQSLRVAADSKTIYLTGYKITTGSSNKAPLFFRSDNAGNSWTQITVPGNVTLSPTASAIDILGVNPDDPMHVYMRVELEDGLLSDAAYVSTNGGVAWTKIDSEGTSILGFVVRAAKNTGGKHDLVIATQTLGSKVSHDDGATFTPLTNPPHINCLVENKAGEIWACTQNYGFNGAMSDDAGVMKTTDLTTWTKVLRYQDLTDAVTCAAGTPQHDSCAPQWCAICAQLGCTPPASYACPAIAGAMEAPMVTNPKGSGGCCDAGAPGAGGLALGLAVGTLLLRPRRRRAA